MGWCVPMAPTETEQPEASTVRGPAEQLLAAV